MGFLDRTSLRSFGTGKCGKIILAGVKIIFAGGKIILAGGKIILAGGKIILTGGKIINNGMILFLFEPPPLSGFWLMWGNYFGRWKNDQ